MIFQDPLLEPAMPGWDEVVSLLTTVAGEYDRISHHGVRASLLEEQARAVGAPLHRLDLPARPACTNDKYEELMAGALQRYLREGIKTVAFGDIHLRDLRAYREEKLAQAGMKGLFPLWGEPTGDLVRRFIADGFQAYLTCVTLKDLGELFAGRALDSRLLDDLPETVDPYGENGEYHSFVYDGPVFQRPVPVRVGKTVVRDVRAFADLLPETGDPGEPESPPLEEWPEARPPSQSK